MAARQAIEQIIDLCLHSTYAWCSYRWAIMAVWREQVGCDLIDDSPFWPQ